MEGIVYKIEVNKEIYIGSTILNMKERQRLHNLRLKRNEIYKLYDECRKYDINEIICIPIEKKIVGHIDEIRLLENKYIKELRPTLNHNASHRSEEEKREYKKEYMKEFYKKNKTYIKNRMKEKIECDVCGCFVSRRNISIHKKTKNCLNKIE